MAQELPSALPSSGFTGEVRPREAAHWPRKASPFSWASRSAVFTAGMFIEWMTAMRSGTSPLKSSPKFCGFQERSESRKTTGASVRSVEGVKPSCSMAAE